MINKIPGMHIRESEEDELRGLDHKYLNDVDWDDHYTNGWTTPYPQNNDGVPVVSGLSVNRQPEPMVTAPTTKQE